MDKWADFCISKLSMNDGLISSIVCYRDLGNSISTEKLEKDRTWMVNKISQGKTFCSIKRTTEGNWSKLNHFSYNGLFSWGTAIPKNLTRPKTFVSFYHNDDESYRQQFDNLFGDLIVSKSVKDGEIDSESSDEYIKQLIQSDCLCDTTILVVLVGPNTKCRKHVDWEISGALDLKVGDRYAGLLGVLLPSHPEFGLTTISSENLPARLAKNFESGYALIVDWTDDRVAMQRNFENVLSQRENDHLIVNRSLPQLQRNLCD